MHISTMKSSVGSKEMKCLTIHLFSKGQNPDCTYSTSIKAYVFGFVCWPLKKIEYIKHLDKLENMLVHN